MVAEGIPAVVAHLATGMKLAGEIDHTMARLYAGGILSAELSVLQTLRLGGAEGDWFVREGEEPTWGIGVRLDFAFNRSYIVCSLRRDTPAAALYITVERIVPDRDLQQELLRVTYTVETGFMCWAGEDITLETQPTLGTEVSCREAFEIAVRKLFDALKNEAAHIFDGYTRLSEY